jgi:uncharacterized membrane protein YhaH (DUF805 family)
MNSNMTPIDWAKRPIQKYADFRGRAPRAEYWWYVLGLVVVLVVLMIIEAIVGLNKMILGVYGPLTALFYLATFVPGIAVSVRRLHDTNRSGWWLLLIVPYLISAALMMRALAGATAAGTAPAFGAAGILGLIGLVGCIVLLVFYCLPGTPGDNRYGADPYGQDVAATFA